MEGLIDEYCFKDWKARGRCTGCEEIRERLNISSRKLKYTLEEEQILNYLEYVSNLIWLGNEKCITEDTPLDDEYTYLQENVLALIEDMGYEARVFEEEEKVLLLEKDAAVTSAAEIADDDIAYEILEYNHFTLKGDIGEKKRILLLLTEKFEPTRRELGKINPTLESNIGYLLNKMNIRHNNKVGANASDYVAHISDDELEEWYDETFQMLLLAMLESDNVSRNKRITELKQKIDG